MNYIFDEILQRMVYTVIEEGTNVDKAVKIADEFKQLNEQTQEYLLTRLQILVEEQKDDTDKD